MTLFQPAARQQRKLRLGLIGPSGSGKTFTALMLASALGEKIAVIDTERGSASAYADRFNFDTLQLTSFSPDKYLEGIRGAAGYDVLIIDSLSHAWSGKDGILEFVDKVAARSRSGNSFGAWREATPEHNKLVDGILDAAPHVIVTMRAKTEYVQEKDERTGKTSVRKVGMQPVQRDGLEYEFDIIADLDWSNTLVVSKTRCEALQGYVAKPAGDEFAGIVRDWLGSGAPAPAPTQPAAATQADDDSQFPPEPPEGLFDEPSEPAEPRVTAPQLKALHTRLTKLGFNGKKEDKDLARDFISHMVKRDLASSKDLTRDEAHEILGLEDDKLARKLDEFNAERELEAEGVA